jgi:hypothetical protein
MCGAFSREIGGSTMVCGSDGMARMDASQE